MPSADGQQPSAAVVLSELLSSKPVSQLSEPALSLQNPDIESSESDEGLMSDLVLVENKPTVWGQVLDLAANFVNSPVSGSYIVHT